MQVNCQFICAILPLSNKIIQLVRVGKQYMNKKFLAAVFIFVFSLTAFASAEPRWQKIITTDQYRYYFDTLTISYGKTVPKNERDDIKTDRNIIDFNAQKIYWNPQDMVKTLQQIDNHTDWSTLSYSVGHYQYDKKNKKLFQGNISFFDANGMLIGTINRSIWQDIILGSDEEKIYNCLVEYAKKHNQELTTRS